MKIINPKLFHPANGHYSQAIEHNGIIYISGQLPLDPENDNLIPQVIRSQTELVLQKLDSILLTAGSNRNQVIQVKIYIHGINHWSEVNEVYTSFFGSHKPVRCIIPVPELHYGALIELEATAVTGSKS